MMLEKVVIHKAWKSELARLSVFFVALILAPLLSNYIPASIVSGPLFSIGRYTIILDLPLFWLVPSAILVEALARIYNVRYIIDEEGIEATDGILAMNQSITRVRHADVRSIETRQSIWQRIIDVGNIEVSTAATSAVEVEFKGVAGPRKLQDWLNGISREKKSISEQSKVSAEKGGTPVSAAA